MGKVTCIFLSLVTSEKLTAEPQVWLNKCAFQLPWNVYGNSSEVSVVTLHFHSDQWGQDQTLSD